MKNKKTIIYNQTEIINEELNRIEKYLDNVKKTPTTVYGPNIAVKNLADAVSSSSDLRKLLGLS
ncbi:MAG: hypothetical protein D3913_10525 [Candidatus Electrothrix sp. LOE1_4_5]|nr:hypothetical protein [Candidatus Electrothrix gigas]